MKLPLWNNGEIYQYAEVDESDYKALSGYRWGASIRKYGNFPHTYGMSKINGRIVYLHRYIANPGEGMVVDHIDKNTLNNRRSNLRVCTQKENSASPRRVKTPSQVGL